MAFFGERIGADEAQQCGLVARVVEAGQALASARAFAADFAGRVDRDTIDVAKRILNDATALPLAAATLVNLLTESGRTRSRGAESVVLLASPCTYKGNKREKWSTTRVGHRSTPCQSRAISLGKIENQIASEFQVGDYASGLKATLALLLREVDVYPPVVRESFGIHIGQIGPLYVQVPRIPSDDSARPRFFFGKSFQKLRLGVRERSQTSLVR